MGKTSSKDNLTPKQRAFVKAYKGQSRGNATEAARLAGYKQPEKMGYQNLQKLAIRSALGPDITSNPRIASPERLQEFWTGVLEGGELDAKMNERLKASELLAKCQGMFIERKEITGKDGGPIEVDNRAEKAVKALTTEELRRMLNADPA